MTSDTRSPTEIEREIEDQRSDLTANLEGLQDKFSIDTMVRQIGDQFREHGGDMGRSIADQVKANPIPLALTGLGLAWMIFGNSNKPAATKAEPHDGYSSAEHDFRRAQKAQGRPYVAPTYSASIGYTGPSWVREDDDDSSGFGERLTDGADVVRSKAAQGSAAVSDAASHVKDRLMDAGGRIAEGTESLSEEGRQRVIAARQKAVVLRRSAASSAQDGADAVSDLYDRQPLVVGALALAVGAALGGALPRTKTEDDLMGAHSDNIYDEAERIFEEEKSKALSVARSVKDEVKDIAAETKADLDGGAPGEAIGDKAKSMAGRVANKAKASAKDEKLGKPKA